MLPGPPRECLPMFQQNVLNILKDKIQSRSWQVKKWLVFDIRESEIGAAFDKLMANYACETGYRFHYPYIEVKLLYHDHNDEMLDIADQYLAPLCLNQQALPASEILKNKLSSINKMLTIADKATQGRLQVQLLSPELKPYLKFVESENADIVIHGLSRYWNRDDNQDNHIAIQIGDKQFKRDVLFNHHALQDLCVEFACQIILDNLITH